MDDRPTPPASISAVRALKPREEAAPPAPLLTPIEQGIVKDSVRTFVKGIVPHLPALAKFGGPAAGFVLLFAQHWVGKAETEHKVDVGYQTTADVVIHQAEEIAELKRAVAQLADSNALQARLALASRPGFDDKGKPETRVVVASHARRAAHPASPPADPTLVKKVVEDAKKNAALQARLVVESHAAVALPHTLPSEVPKPVAEPWPPPVPVVQPIHDASNPSQ